MSLTKEDFDQIVTLMDGLMRQYFLPLYEWKEEVVEWRMEVDEWRKEVDEWRKKIDISIIEIKQSLKSLHQRMDRLVFDTEEKISNHEQLLGSYVNDFVNKKDFHLLERRVKTLESPQAI